MVTQIPAPHANPSTSRALPPLLTRTHYRLELSRFELLLASHLPDLHAHLQSAGLPAVLYASQWFLTFFASPFPLHFGGRILDVLLQSGSDGVLPRVALALLEALQSELLALDDFEAIITAVKVENWRGGVPGAGRASALCLVVLIGLLMTHFISHPHRPSNPPLTQPR